jgi:hypothetical protein
VDNTERTSEREEREGHWNGHIYPDLTHVNFMLKLARCCTTKRERERERERERVRDGIDER